MLYFKDTKMDRNLDKNIFKANAFFDQQFENIIQRKKSVNQINYFDFLGEILFIYFFLT